MDTTAIVLAALGLAFTLLGVAYYMGRVMGDLTRQVFTLGRNYGDLLILIGKIADHLKEVELEVLKISKNSGG